MPQLTMAQLKDDIVFTNTGRWLKCNGSCWHDELGYRTHLTDEDEPLASIHKKWPKLHEGEIFNLIYKPKNFGNFDCVLFKTARNYRFRIQLNNCRLTIPFLFTSTDSRVGDCEATWSAPAGKLLRELDHASLFIKYIDKPVLHIMNFTSLMEVPNQ